MRTTTLEGGHDWDTWLAEGATGNDTEFVNAGEPTPFTEAGFVRPERFPVRASVTGQIKGRVLRGVVYIPQVGGVAYNGTSFPGGAGTQTDGPVKRPWIALSDLDGGDQKVYTARGNKDGTFVIRNVPDSSYAVTIWDDEQDYLLDTYAVTVRRGQVVDMGQPTLVGWFTRIDGHVFLDLNENGRRDPGERGVPGYDRRASRPAATHCRIRPPTWPRPTSAATTSSRRRTRSGSSWCSRPTATATAPRASRTRRRTSRPRPRSWAPASTSRCSTSWARAGGSTGASCRTRRAPTAASSAPSPTTRHATSSSPRSRRSRTGSRASRASRCACGAPVPDPNDEEGYLKNADGSYVRAGIDVNGTPDDYTDDQPLQTYTTETWQRPKGCTARDVDGNPVVDQMALPVFADPTRECVEAPMTGVQFGGDEPADSTVEEPNYFSSVNGNYGFGDLPAGDYLVQVVIPNDPVLGRPLLKPTREEDINVFDGDQFEPRISFQPVRRRDPHGRRRRASDRTGRAPLENPAFADDGGCPYEGDVTPLCDAQLVKLRDRRSVAPVFSVLHRRPDPDPLLGLVIDDLNVSVDPKTTFFGEKAGIANAPVGFYDFTGRLVYTQQTDPNGIFDVLLPSSEHLQLPDALRRLPERLPIVGNDPGRRALRNPTYDPHFRTFATCRRSGPGSASRLMLRCSRPACARAAGDHRDDPPACKHAHTTPRAVRDRVPDKVFGTTPRNRLHRRG